MGVLKLLSQHADTLAIQTIAQRKSQVGLLYPREALRFQYTASGYPILEIADHSRVRELDFSSPRFFDFASWKAALGSPLSFPPKRWLEAVEAHMRRFPC